MAQPEDAAGCAHVNLLSWRSAYKGLIADATLAKLSFDELLKKWEWRFAQNDPGVFCFVALSDKTELIGYVLCGKNRHPKVETERELMAIYLLDEWRNKGIGKLFVQKALEVFRSQQVSSFVVFALNGNHPTRKFYEAFGPDESTEEEIVIDGITYLHTGYIWKKLPSVPTIKNER